MRWLWLLVSGWLVASPAVGLLAPPLPPLPIEESIADHKFNGDGSPDEELQLSLFNEKSEFSMKSQEIDLLTDDITKKSGESREIPTTVADKGGEVEESQEIIEPIPPEPQAAETAPPRHHPGPPSIRPPISIETTEDTTTTDAPTTTTIETTTTESTTTTTTTATMTTTTARQPTEEPRVLIPIPGEEIEPELLTKEPEEVQESFIFVPEVTIPTIIPEFSTREPLVLVPLPEAPVEVADIVKEASFHENSEDFTTIGPETTSETTPLNEEFFFDTQEPLVTVPLPDDVTIIPTIANRITIKHRIRTSKRPILSTTTEEAPAAIVFQPEKEEEAMRTTLPTPIEPRITETELVDELVKGLPHVGTTIKSGPVTVIPPRAQPTPSGLASTRRSGDVTVKERARVLHRGQAKKIRRTGKLRTRRPIKIRPTTIQPKSPVFRNSSDVVHHRVSLHKKKIRRLRKKKLGESRRLLTTTQSN